MKQLSQKLAVLMVLAEASRTSELGALDVQYRVFKPEGILFWLPTLTKKRKVGAPPREISLEHILQMNGCVWWRPL